MMYFTIVTETTEKTVVTEYKPNSKRAENYQSEAEMECEFIAIPCAHLHIYTKPDMVDNLRKRVEVLNNYAFSDIKWTYFFSESLANPNEDIDEKIRKIQDNTKNAAHDVYTKLVVIVFGECHYSQFNDMYEAIIKKFKKYHLFGFMR